MRPCTLVICKLTIFTSHRLDSVKKKKKNKKGNFCFFIICLVLNSNLTFKFGLQLLLATFTCNFARGSKFRKKHPKFLEIFNFFEVFWFFEIFWFFFNFFLENSNLVLLIFMKFLRLVFVKPVRPLSFLSVRIPITEGDQSYPGQGEPEKVH